MSTNGNEMLLLLPWLASEEEDGILLTPLEAVVVVEATFTVLLLPSPAAGDKTDAGDARSTIPLSVRTKSGSTLLLPPGADGAAGLVVSPPSSPPAVRVSASSSGDRYYTHTRVTITQRHIKLLEIARENKSSILKSSVI